ncbi:MAG: formate/nitrite transporter family protein [Muribaculaceae bacterium]|nr:formate/nitrite transporter family protein [Muribaculaceae bacterium]
MPLRTPQEIQQTAFEAGINKAKRPIGRLIVGSVLAGAFIALGGVLSIITGYGLPELTAGNPAVQRIVSGLFFPIGLMLVVVLGADLFTGNNALLVSPLLKRQLGIGTVAKNWCIVWAGNFVGALLVAYFLVYLTGITAAAPYSTALNTIAVAKTSAPWWVVMLKGIGANWCVCLAIWLALSGRHLGEKLLACEIPIMAFVALGFEHCVANMFFLPLAMMQGAPIGIADMMLRNILPATIGNIIGGAILVGLAHDYLQRK